MTESEQLVKDDLLFNIQYNYRASKMTAILFGRFDRLLSFLIIFLGGSIFSGSIHAGKFAIVIAICLALQQVFKYSSIAESAKQQAQKYLNLIRDEQHLNIEELKNKLKDVELSDVDHLKAIEFGAMQRTTVYLDIKVDGNDIIKLTQMQKMLCFLAGDNPSSEYKNQIKNK